MSTSDKRRSASTHAVRPSAASRNNVIAAPPRAQLTGPASSSSSPGPESDAGSSSTTKESTAAQAAKEKENLLIKEKDEQIAELKREVERRSQNESETASFWQVKHSNLHQQFLRADTELRLRMAELEVREAERGELLEGWENLRTQVQDRDDEIRTLKGQVRGLKEWVSTSTKTDNQTSDEVFGVGMAKLANGLQNWVITNFRKSKLDLARASEDVVEELTELVPTYDALAATAKVHLLQSIVSTILVEMIFDSYFVGLSPEQATHFRQMESHLADFGSVEAVNQWRAMTLTILRKESDLKMQASTMAFVTDVIARINRVLDSITDAKATEHRDQALRSLVNNAIELSRSLVVQKAVFRVDMPRILPHQQTFFDPEKMEDIGGEEEESLTAREICCITFPGVIKSGDEHGGQLEYTNIISKARVLCSPE